MSNLSYSQLEGLWIHAGGSSALAPVMAAIALAESSGNPGAVNPNDNGGRQSSFGLWQISNGTHSPPASNWNNPQVNASLAVAKYHNQGLGAWGTYTSGVYKKFLQGNVPPSGNFPNGPGSGGAGSGPFGLSTLASFLGGGPLAQFVTDPIDALERIGLVIFGSILILVGIFILAMPAGSRALGTAAGTSRDFRAAGALLGGTSGPPSDDRKIERQERLQLAQRNVALGERKQNFRESREARLARGRRHIARKEPNPNPQHN